LCSPIFQYYDEFKVAFSNRFGPNAADKGKCQQKILHVRQGKKESVGSYYTRYLQLLDEMKAIGKAVDAEQQIVRFIDGLSPSLSVEVVSIHRRTIVMTLDAAMSEAEMEEKANPSPKPVPRALNGMQTKLDISKSRK
jgi:hypothetical protein